MFPLAALAYLGLARGEALEGVWGTRRHAAIRGPGVGERMVGGGAVRRRMLRVEILSFLGVDEDEALVA